MLRTGELARLRATQSAHMHDTCLVLAYSTATDEYNNPIPSYSAGSAIACGFDPSPSRESGGEAEVNAADAALRLPVTVAPSNDDRIRITHVHGDELSPALTYEILGMGERGATAHVYLLELVTDGS